MTSPAIAAVALYAGLNALVLFWLMVETGRTRMREKVPMGDGGNLRLIRVMRGHANAIEIVPVALILLLTLALLGTPAWAIHGLGLILTLGRLFHAMHFIAADAPRWQRAAGALSSAILLVAGGAWAIVAGFAQAF
ncbi:MAPEG family protein [Aureimonas sp. SA4125]|uniref:MAPEG family protein n=1 Tax=Aureimonas sp. SA4125 TaxID=2826993 RepID=UPI001CC66BF6|nr:MAPEG family protein [Aureimonas sp. SA4125]